MNHPPFEANRFPLEPGLRLLEASAGTGKTFALAHLVLRLLSEGSHPLEVEQLLVVTFTEAAAAELRDRIARRLQQAVRLLQGGDLGSVDAPLQEWMHLQDAESSQTRGLEGRLLLALERLDRADITTIHGFCRRTLQRQALEAGLGPAVDLEQQAHERREQLVHDYWQQQVLPLPPSFLAGLQQHGIHPDGLVKLLAAIDSDPSLRLDALPEDVTIETSLSDQLVDGWAELWGRFLKLWEAKAQLLEAGLAAAAVELKALGASYSPYRLKAKPDRLGKIQAWIGTLKQTVPGYDDVLGQPDLQKYFHPGPFTKVAAPVHGDQVSLPEQELMECIALLVDGPAERLLLHFSHWGRRELRQRRERSGQISFGQLLERLDPGTSDDITPLLKAVAKRYRAALIDEFQDTDPIQWRILERAFGRGSGRHLLVIVGDPKQAIYRFRGGELATYKLAAASSEACFGLYENRRSSAALVQALNGLMQPGLQRTCLAIPAVEAKAEKGTLQLPENQSPLQILELQTDLLEQQVASTCQSLLEQQLILRTDHDERPLAPGDICCLVSQHAQAEALRIALERRQLPSRLVSKGDVFETEGATALQRFLDALARPGDDGRQRLLAASPLLGWSAEDIKTADGFHWDHLAAELGTLAERLPRQGLTAVLAQLQGVDGLAKLSLRGRMLADVQQVAELVQERMHQQGLGALQAADWLRRQRLQNDAEIPDAHLCRSDAAESAIAVVTVHRSKGLEYPVVLCPYLWKGQKTIKADRRQLGRRWTPPGHNDPHLDLHLNPYWGQGRLAAQQDQQAQIAEAERLAYVACTRAQHLLVLGWPGADCAEEGNPLSPWLLEHGQERTLPLHRLACDNSADASPWQPAPPEGTLSLGPTPTRSLDQHWGRSSYSAWAHSQAPLSPEMREEGRDTDAMSLEPDPEPERLPSKSTSQEPRGVVDPMPWPELGPLAQFPRGAGPGDALHRILERINYSDLAAGDSNHCRELIEQELPRAGISVDWTDALLEGLIQLVRTPLGGPLGDCRLGDLQPGQWLNEMNFDLPLAHCAKATEQGENRQRLVRSSGLARVFEHHAGGLFNSRYGHQLQRLEVASRGFLTGSIDLVFCWQERWWVADWKSNWLGERDDDGSVRCCGPIHYREQAMVELMEANHYPLQAHLYLVALHRYLSWRLPDYDPAKHLGGYSYVFLRGVPGPINCEGRQASAATPGVLVDQPSLKRILALDTLLREGQP